MSCFRMILIVIPSSTADSDTHGMRARYYEKNKPLGYWRSPESHGLPLKINYVRDNEMSAGFENDLDTVGSNERSKSSGP